MSTPVNPCLWFDGKSRDVARFYEATFPDAWILGGTSPIVEVQVGDLKLTLLDGGPGYTVNPAMSFFYNCDGVGCIDTLWKALVEGGSVLMALDEYPFARRYGWVADRFGVNWQLCLPSGTPRQKVFPSLLFTQDRCGRAEEALRFTTSVFPDSSVGTISRYGPGQAPDREGTVNYGEFCLGGQWFTAMDSAYPHQFTFTAGTSLVVTCDTQAEIDRLWGLLTDGGSEVRCGWLEDRFGVSWQVVPRVLGELMADPTRSERVVQTFLGMKKLDIEALLRA